MLQVPDIECLWFDADGIPEALSRLPLLEQLKLQFFFDPLDHLIADPVLMDRQKIRWQRAMQDLVPLQSIELHSPTTSFEWKIFVDMIQGIGNLKDIGLTGKRVFKKGEIESVISISPKILSIKFNAQMNRAFTAKFFDKMSKKRAIWHRNAPQLSIFIEAEKANELKKATVNCKTKTIRICSLKK